VPPDLSVSILKGAWLALYSRITVGGSGTDRELALGAGTVATGTGEGNLAIFTAQNGKTTYWGRTSTTAGTTAGRQNDI
jgi:hypothetical protein